MPLCESGRSDYSDVRNENQRSVHTYCPSRLLLLMGDLLCIDPSCLTCCSGAATPNISIANSGVRFIDLTRHKISDGEPPAAPLAGKRSMVNSHSVNRRLARGSLHRMVRSFGLQSHSVSETAGLPRVISTSLGTGISTFSLTKVKLQAMRRL